VQRFDRLRQLGEHAAEAAQQHDAAMRRYVQDATATAAADQLTKLADLRSTGAIDDGEYEQFKAKVLAS
jgi:hypothetical protein